MLLGNCKSKQQGDTITQLLEWLKSKILVPPNASEDVEQHEFSSIAGGDAQWCSHLGRWFGSFS